MILDTTFVIDLLRNDAQAVAVARQIEETEIVKTTAITVYEIYQGLKSDESMRKVDSFFRNIIILDFTKDAAKKAGELSRELRRRGQTIEPEDCMIAALCLLSNEVILTNNIKHFSRISGLKTRTY